MTGHTAGSAISIKGVCGKCGGGTFALRDGRCPECNKGGKWTADDEMSYAGGHGYQVRQDGRRLCVANVFGTPDEARLVASAPLLLEALKELMEHEPVREDFQSTRRGDHQFEAAKAAWDRARSAIAAATRSET